MLLEKYRERQALATEILDEFAKYHSPISMAASEQTGAFLWTLLDVLKPEFVIETGSGYTTVILAEWLKEQRAGTVLPQVYHVEENEAWKQRVLQHLERVDRQPGTFIDYPDLYQFTLDRPFFALLDGLRSERPVVARWLVSAARRGVFLIDDAQEGTNPEVQASLDVLEHSKQGVLYDLKAWTTDIYQRSAKLFVGFDAGVPSGFLCELASPLPNLKLIPQNENRLAESIAESILQDSDQLPLISIVITCYNKMQYIGQAIESALTQTYPHLEVIVVNDGSSDDSLTVIHRYSESYADRLRIIDQENQGVSKTRDAGVQVASGKYVVLLDGDDFLAPDAVQSWFDYAQQHPEHTVIHSNAIRVDEAGIVTGSHIPKEQRLKVEGDILSSLLGWGLVTSSSLIEREKILEVGGYSFLFGLRGHDDYFLYLRLLLAGYTFGYLDRFLLFYRDISATISKDVSRGNTFKYSVLQYVYAQHIERMVAAAQELTALGLQERDERLRLKDSLTPNSAEQQLPTKTRQTTLAQREALRNEYEGRIAELNTQLEQTNSLQQQLDAERQTIITMRNTRGWKMLERWWNFKQKWLPSSSQRRRVAELQKTFLTILRSEGPFALLKRMLKWLGGERRYHNRTHSSVVPAHQPSSPQVSPQSRMQRDASITDVLRARFPELKPLATFQVNQSERRLNLVTDSINSGSLFGGVATALIFAALLAEKWNCDLRIVTRTEKAQARNFGAILQANGIPFTRNVEFLFAPPNAEAGIPVGEGDVFLTTSWWTTESVRQTVNSRRIVYILQEDERTFYPFGDDHVRCVNVLRDPNITFVLNSQLLYRYLVEDGFDNIERNGFWFEPSWPESLFFYEQSVPDDEKRNFFFYARPQHTRNLFYLGLQTIDNAIIHGVLDPAEWNFHFVGKDVPNLRIAASTPAIIHQNLSWTEYASLVRRVDLGLSLMYSPHPSYPPIDLAASGAVVVTNTFANKQNLSLYSDNILCRELQVDALVEGLEAGVKLVMNPQQRLQNYRQNRLLRNWQSSFSNVLGTLEALEAFAARENA